MYGDPFVSLVVSVLFAIIFINTRPFQRDSTHIKVVPQSNPVSINKLFNI
jgi:hypothetical protein